MTPAGPETGSSAADGGRAGNRAPGMGRPGETLRAGSWERVSDGDSIHSRAALGPGRGSRDGTRETVERPVSAAVTRRRQSRADSSEQAAWDGIRIYGDD